MRLLTGESTEGTAPPTDASSASVILLADAQNQRVLEGRASSWLRQLAAGDFAAARAHLLPEEQRRWSTPALARRVQTGLTPLLNVRPVVYQPARLRGDSARLDFLVHDNARMPRRYQLVLRRRDDGWWVQDCRELRSRTATIEEGMQAMRRFSETVRTQPVAPP